LKLNVSKRQLIIMHILIEEDAVLARGAGIETPSAVRTSMAASRQMESAKVLINLRVPVISEISLIAPKAEGCLKWAGMNGLDGSSGVILVTMSSPRLGGAVNCGGAGLDFCGTRSVSRVVLTGDRGRIAGVEVGVIVCVPIVPHPLRSILCPEP